MRSRVLAIGALLLAAMTALLHSAHAEFSGPPAVTSAIVNGSYNLTTATGTQTVSGFGFTPSACDGMGSINSGATQYTTLNAHSDAALNQSSLNMNASAFNLVNNSFFQAVDTTGSNAQIGVISAYNNGSITISWTKAGSPTGTFNFSIRCFK